MKKLLSLCLALTLCVSLLAGVTMPASAATSGTCGDNVRWTLNGSTLIISGTGAMEDYTSYSSTPWYYNRSNIKTIIIKDGVTSIGQWVFSYCNALTSITISDSVTSIEYGAFYECDTLTSIIIPNDLTRIGGYAFYGCNSLTSITISDSVKTIADGTFCGCNSLTSITIPNGVTIIEILAFSGCTKLTDVYYGGDETDRNKISIGNYNESLTNATWHYATPAITLSTVNGAQIRTTGAQGLRFISSIDKTSLDFDRVVEYGTVLIPSADITDISELQIGATLNGHTVAKVPANYLYAETDETVTYTAVLTNIAEKNYAREYTARAYAIMDDGTVVYSDSGASRSIYIVAKRGLDNPNELEANKEVFRKIVLAVEGTNSGDSGIY